MTDLIGKQLGNYRLIRLLGKGGFAEVYLGHHLYLKTQAAIKVLHTRLIDDDMENFLTEAQTIASLVHPHIVRVLEFGVEGDIPFLVMDYAPNGTLRQRYSKGALPSYERIVHYVKQVAEALQYAHDKNLIHRDIKPENMLLGTNKSVLLSDFGIALLAQSSSHQSTQGIIGTTAYMAPEQLKGKPRPASDQYSLGIVVYEWLTGERPFRGSFAEIASQHMFVPPPPLYEKVPEISSAVENVVMTALEKEPHQRFASLQEFADALEHAFQAKTHRLPAPLSDQSLPSPAPIKPRRITVPPRSLPPPEIPVIPPQSRHKPAPITRNQRRVHWLIPLGMGLIATLILWLVGTSVFAWGEAKYVDILYGVPRTYQADAVVGHGGDSLQHPSHFIAINLNRQVIVIEFPAGNPARAETYLVPYYILGSGGDLTPITLEFRDVTGDGETDMIIHIHLQNQDQTFVFVNNGTRFRPPTSKDNIHM